MEFKKHKRMGLWLLCGVSIFLAISAIIYVAFIRQEPKGVPIYLIGGDGWETNIFTMKVEHEESELRWVVTFSPKNGHENEGYYFQCYIQYTGDCDLDDVQINNSSSFKCTEEDGELVSFDEKSRVEFTGQKTFYIGYANASEKEQEAIAAAEYFLVIDDKPFIMSKNIFTTECQGMLDFQQSFRLIMSGDGGKENE